MTSSRSSLNSSCSSSTSSCTATSTRLSCTPCFPPSLSFGLPCTETAEDDEDEVAMLRLGSCTNCHSTPKPIHCLCDELMTNPLLLSILAPTAAEGTAAVPAMLRLDSSGGGTTEIFMLLLLLWLAASSLNAINDCTV